MIFYKSLPFTIINQDREVSSFGILFDADPYLCPCLSLTLQRCLNASYCHSDLHTIVQPQGSFPKPFVMCLKSMIQCVLSFTGALLPALYGNCNVLD